MRSRLLAAALSMSALAIAVPGAAPAQRYQSSTTQGRWDGNGFWRDAPRDVWQRIDWLQHRIDRGIADGSLDRQEARRSQQEVGNIRRVAMRMRSRSRGALTARQRAIVQGRLDNVSRELRFRRNNDQARYPSTAGRDRFATNYDASRDYRDGPNYSERRLSANDQVYRGSDGRYYCKRNDGTTGLIVGAAGGGLLGNIIDGGHNRVAGTLIGGALGALAGKAIEQNNDVRCR